MVRTKEIAKKSPRKKQKAKKQGEGNKPKQGRETQPLAGGRPRKPHRFRPGTQALKKFDKLSNDDDCEISDPTFEPAVIVDPKREDSVQTRGSERHYFNLALVLRVLAEDHNPDEESDQFDEYQAAVNLPPNMVGNSVYYDSGKGIW